MACFKLRLKDTDQLLHDHGMDEGGIVQNYVDNEVIRLCDPYVPMLSGTLKNSAKTASDIGGGVVRYKTPYARHQYYTQFRNYSNQSGLRGSKWFERMKADHLGDILSGAQEKTK